MGYKSKQKMIKNGNTNGKKALKELFNISSHQGNANKNCFEITSYKSEKPRSIKQMITYSVKDAE